MSQWTQDEHQLTQEEHLLLLPFLFRIEVRERAAERGGLKPFVNNFGCFGEWLYFSLLRMKEENKQHAECQALCEALFVFDSGTSLSQTR